MNSEQNRLVEALKQAEQALRRVRVLVGGSEETNEDELWARRMVSVLAEVDRRGGRVAGDTLLAIGETFGYRRRGMAGFYQDLLQRDGDDAVLTDEGRRRLERLRSRYEELPTPPVTSAFWRGIGVLDPEDPFVRNVHAPKPHSGTPYDAEDAKRDLYKHKP